MTETQPVDLCLASLRFYPDYAGPAQRFQRYAAGFQDRRVAMRVFSAAWPDDGLQESQADPLSDGELLPPLREQGIDIHRVWIGHPHNRDRLLMTYFRGLARYCLSGRRPDVLLLLNSWFLLPLWLWRVKRAGVPVVYVQTMVRDPSVGALRNLMWGLPLRFCDRIVVSTGVMREKLRASRVSTPVEVIPNGVDLTRFRPCGSSGERASLRSGLGLQDDWEVVTFVGGFLSRRKGLDVLVEAWARLAHERPRARLVLVGPHLNTLRPAGPQAAFLEKLRDSMRRSGAEDRVLFTGKVDAVEDYLRATDVFVFPSRLEGMPNVVPEAFACGVASVLTPFVGLPSEFGEPGREYVLVDRSPDAIATAVVDLLEDPDRRSAFGDRARKWVQRELDVNGSLDRYAQLFRDLLPGEQNYAAGQIR